MQLSMVIKGEKGTFFDLDFLVFLTKISDHISHNKDPESKERLRIINKVFSNGSHKNVLEVLTFPEWETLRELYVRGLCHKCRQPFAWKDQFHIRFVVAGSKGQQPLHRRCAPKTKFSRPNSHPSPALKN